MSFILCISLSTSTVVYAPTAVASGEISINVPAYQEFSPALYTFDKGVNMSYVLQSGLLNYFGNDCILANSTNAPLSLSSLFEDLLLQSTTSSYLQIFCAQDNLIVVLQTVQPTHHSRFPFDPKLLHDPSFLEQAHHYMQHKHDTPKEYPYEPADVTADGIVQALEWAWWFVKYHWGPMHPFNTYQDTDETGIYHLDTGVALEFTGQTPAGFKREKAVPIKMAMAADWGSGTRESDYVAQLMIKDFNPHYTVHIGDVYTVGAPEQIASNCLGIPPPNVQKGVFWPHGSVGTFALNGNHETFSRCYGYFDHWLPTIGMKDTKSGNSTGQKASFFALENEFWRVVSLDTGYNTYSILVDNNDNIQPEPVIDWLLNVVKLNDPNDKRGIIILSHHQYRSAFDHPFNGTAKQLADIIPKDRQVLWLWGHEHRIGWYNLSNAEDVDLNVYARCIGVGGFPTSLGYPDRARQAGLQVFDDRTYELVTGLTNMTVGYNGYAQLLFDNEHVSINYYSLELDANGKVSNQTASPLVSEKFSFDTNTGNVFIKEFNVLNKNLTVVHNL